MREERAQDEFELADPFSGVRRFYEENCHQPFLFRPGHLPTITGQKSNGHNGPLFWTCVLRIRKIRDGSTILL